MTHATDPTTSTPRHRAALGPLDLGPLAEAARRSLNGEHPGDVGTMLPPLVDHHVHLMIVGTDALADTALAAVLDLGAPLDLVTARRHHDGLPRVEFAGAFLTARGGYPVGRPWASDGSAREIDPYEGNGRSALPGPAETAVSEQHAFGASVIKVALNATAGPVFDRATLDAVIGAAHDRGLPVVAHVEGDGMTRLAIDAGVDALAHTPFTERVDDDLIARAVAAGQRWITTLFVTSYGEPSPDRDRRARQPAPIPRRRRPRALRHRPRQRRPAARREPGGGRGDRRGGPRRARTARRDRRSLATDDTGGRHLDVRARPAACDARRPTRMARFRVHRAS